MANDNDRQNAAPQKPGNVHDIFFRSIFMDAAKVVNIFKLAFSPEQLAHFNLSTIVIEPRDLLNADEMSEYQADLVVSVRLKSGENLSVYVLTEHKSHPDSKLMVQLLKYQAHLYVHKQADAVLPVVVYHGLRKNWPGTRSFLQSRRLPVKFAEDFADMLLSFGVSLVNIREQSSRGRYDGIDFDVELAFKFMVDIWKADEKTFADLMEQSLVLPKQKRRDLVTPAALYLKKFKPEITIDTMKKEVYKRLPGDNAMETISKEWSWLTREEIIKSRWLEGRQEGMAEGMAKGITKGTTKGFAKGYAKARQDDVERLIKKGMSDAQISEITDLTLDEIRQLKNGADSNR